MDEIKFTDLFNEGSIIKFAPKDLDKNTPEIQEFKNKLKAFELEYPLIEDFEVGNLSYLINNNTFLIHNLLLTAIGCSILLLSTKLTLPD